MLWADPSGQVPPRGFEPGSGLHGFAAEQFCVDDVFMIITDWDRDKKGVMLAAAIAKRGVNVLISKRGFLPTLAFLTHPN
jgi:hypothetical protein